MNVEQYKAAVIRKLAEMVKRKNYEPDGLDFGDYDDFIDTREAILDFIIDISEKNISPIELFGILFKSYFIDKVREKFPTWIVKMPHCEINLAHDSQTIEFYDFGTEIFKKLDIDKMKASFFDEFAEFINSDEVTFSLEFSITPKNNFFAKIKMK